MKYDSGTLHDVNCRFCICNIFGHNFCATWIVWWDRNMLWTYMSVSEYIKIIEYVHPRGNLVKISAKFSHKFCCKKLIFCTFWVQILRQLKATYKPCCDPSAQNMLATQNRFGDWRLAIEIFWRLDFWRLGFYMFFLDFLGFFWVLPNTIICCQKTLWRTT